MQKQQMLTFLAAKVLEKWQQARNVLPQVGRVYVQRSGVVIHSIKQVVNHVEDLFDLG